MICVSLGNISVEQCMDAVRQYPFVEIRIDLLKLSDEQLREIFSSHVKLIATCRTGGRYSDPECEKFLELAIVSGADYLDLELETDREFKNRLFKLAKKYECKNIVSFHDYLKTPDRERLWEVLDNCFDCGADIAKIACMVNSKKDAARLLGLLDDEREIIVLGMGELGQSSRIAAMLLDSQIGFATSKKSQATAAGQIEYYKMLTLIKELEGV